MVYEKAEVSSQENVYRPASDLVENSNVMQWMKRKGFRSEKELRAWCSENYVEFWDEMAKTYADWFVPYEKVLEWNPPHARWFVGGKCNVAHNALDRHARSWRRNKVAYYFVGEPVGDTRAITYYQLYRDVNKLANGLKSLGVKKGDRVGIYLPMIPELPVAMLACAKIGAIHVVVFSGFSAGALRERINDAGARVLITCDGSYRRGKPIPIKAQADEALQDAPSVERQIVYRRTGQSIEWKDGFDIWWHELVKNQPDECETLQMDSEDPLFILYTAGAGGKPRGVVHAHGGFCVGPAYTTSWVFDIKDTDVYWSTADIGWITGHTYIVYGPLCLGATSVMYEGSPDYPDFGRWFQIIEDYGVSVIYTAPTAIRMFMKEGEEWPRKYDLRSVRLMGSVGEAMNPDAFLWWRKHVGNDWAPIMDTWFQSETGCHVIAPLPITPLKPGSPAFPLPGYNVDLLDVNGRAVGPGESGNIVLTAPWPTMLRGIYGEPEKLREIYYDYYWSIKPGIYLSGDRARRDADGYWWILGRIDDVLKVAGHRISNAEVESAALSHPNVADAAVIGRPDKVKGENIILFVVLKEGINPSEELKKDIRNHVRATMGPIAMPSEVYFVSAIPKDRTGKPVRAVIKAKALGAALGDTSSVINKDAIDAIPAI
ncbi:MAG: acetate--CoA ligase [Methanothrix sp.]|jgi:acetyl-coenzyme A synthetase (EC 6.2.1.1)|uniref:Acetate--CoA ligase n=1 Tax=Methanothrix thermoacetophila (strain DSM 6194 / JCM 14653 / NBRC 101360 / PT) TaxID=349307 RepID=A0B914_METTP|nr:MULTISPECIES: acetate--CoA ligase [Methanothrix]ABK15188.1 acetyl-coenzyme A synthetase [Methanothrix thermoacetophila PT]MBC7079228.1 acetate--CoA ligase [Methanothrix sp.]NPU86692.1 acetate--CoA ligase [Methanothrix sp.]